MYIHVHIRARTRTILSSRGGWPEEGVRLVIKMQNSSAFNCMEYRNIRAKWISRVTSRHGGKTFLRVKFLPPRWRVCLTVLQFTTSQRIILHFRSLAKGERIIPLLDARQRRSFSSSLLFFPLYPTGNGISNSSWNGRAELDPNCKPQTLASIPSP